MGCFCRVPLSRLDEPVPEAEPESRPPRSELAEAVSAWFTARWLPAEPWQPDPAWLDIPVPELPMPQAGLGVLLALVQARATCRKVLGVDIARPDTSMRLARVVATLDLRLPDLRRFLAADRRPWDELAMLLHHADTIRKAAASVANQARQDERLAEPAPAPSPAWRKQAARVKLLAPLVAIGTAAEIDFAQPDAVRQLAELVLRLRQVTLPPLADIAVVLRLVARLDAIGRIRDILGFDPAPLPFQQVCDAVQSQVEDALDRVPDARLAEGTLVGMPPAALNLSTLLNPATVQATARLPVAALARLDWQVPDFEAFDLLRVGAPVLALTRAFVSVGIDPIAQRPCTRCDAGGAMRAVTFPSARHPPSQG